MTWEICLLLFSPGIKCFIKPNTIWNMDGEGHCQAHLLEVKKVHSFGKSCNYNFLINDCVSMRRKMHVMALFDQRSIWKSNNSSGTKLRDVLMDHDSSTAPFVCQLYTPDSCWQRRGYEPIDYIYFWTRSRFKMENFVALLHINLKCCYVYHYSLLWSLLNSQF